MEIETTNVYDPDPMNVQINAFTQIDVNNLQASDLSKPEIVQILIHNQRVTLTQLKASESKVESLTKQNQSLRNNREELKVEIAEEKVRSERAWLEIPVSMLSGYAINLLAANPSSGQAWFLLILSLFMLIALRGAQLRSFLINVVQARRGNDSN